VRKYTIDTSSSPVLSGTSRDRALAMVERCGGGREHNGQWLICCPSHHDRDPSLSISYDIDKVLLHCHAGCAPETILDALGLTWRDLFDDGRDSPPRPKRPTHLGPRIPDPPGEPSQENIALQVALELIVDDCKLLEVEACQTLFRKAATDPIKKLWIDQQLHRHHLDPATVWRIVQPTPSTRTSGLRTIFITPPQGVSACQA
jgi:hypothetical protein